MNTEESSTNKKPDRRSMRSKRLIIGALRELILEKDFKNISVSDIAKRADIGRATFYAHFEDKEHLERFMFAQLLAEIENELQRTSESNNFSMSPYQSLIPSLALFRVAADKHQWFKMFAGPNGAQLSMLTKPLVERFETQIESSTMFEATKEIPNQIIANYLISALIALLKEWVIKDMPESPETMDVFYQALAEPTLKRITRLNK